MTFLTAAWRKLAFANYPVDPEVLRDLLPSGTELDTWEDRPYVSLIGFVFMDVRLLGVHVPFHVNFEEVNLRFYVRRRVAGQWRRGVVFVKEIVPKPAITFIANTLYGEAYETRPMWHRWTETGRQRRAQYQWRVGDRWQTFSVTADRQPAPIPADGHVEYITEHYWGYSRAKAHRTTEYQVAHPRWEQYTVREHVIDVDFALNYGPRFAFLDKEIPDSVFLAEGSPIKIMGKKTLRFPA